MGSFKGGAANDWSCCQGRDSKGEISSRAGKNPSKFEWCVGQLSPWGDFSFGLAVYNIYVWMRGKVWQNLPVVWVRVGVSSWSWWSLQASPLCSYIHAWHSVPGVRVLDPKTSKIWVGFAFITCWMQKFIKTLCNTSELRSRLPQMMMKTSK